MDSSLGLPPPPPLATIATNGPVSLFLDFDGTLVELAPGPDRIEPRPDLAVCLGDLDARLDHRCALVSGRALDDIERHIGALPLAGAGSHGADVRARDGTRLGGVPNRLPGTIELALREYALANGIDYEDKPHGGALHFRSDPTKGQAAEAFAVQLAHEHGWKAQHGKCVVELVAGDADKGSAVLALMQEPPFLGSRPYFLGDDLTDEAGFVACENFGGGGILVGKRPGTRARYQLADVASVHAWLGI